LAAPDPRSKLVLWDPRVGATAVPQTLVTTKLRVPRTRPNLVERPRLHELLDGGEGRKLTLVSAPAGFGKTTLLVEWLVERSGNGRSGVWLSLDESDNDPARFLSYLVGASRTSWRASGREFWHFCACRNYRPSRPWSKPL
jgi:LuxR family maltose regulon positive regulatory protein